MNDTEKAELTSELMFELMLEHNAIYRVSDDLYERNTKMSDKEYLKIVKKCLAISFARMHDDADILRHLH